jgi:hypothetical protein
MILFVLSASTLRSQNVNIPDPKLLEALIDFGVDTNGDDLISFEEAEAVDSLALYNKITDMTGIEAFVNLRYLDLANLAMETPLNLITDLDLSANLSLEYLDCSYNQLDTLIIGNNDNLLELDCSAQFLTRIDLSGCTNLRILWCYGNPLEELDISNSKQLEVLHLDEILDPFIIYVWMLPYPPEGLTIYGPEGEVQYIDSRPPVVTLLDDYVDLPGIIEFYSDEVGMAYLVQSDAFDTMEQIRAGCLDSVEVAAGVQESFDLSGVNGSTLWIQAVDQSLNISAAAGFSLHVAGIQDEPQPSLEIYPNPARDRISVRGVLKENHTIEICDINGTIIFSGTSASISASISGGNSSGGSFSMDIKNLKKGIYFLRISDGTDVLIQKFVKL